MLFAIWSDGTHRPTLNNASKANLRRLRGAVLLP